MTSGSVITVIPTGTGTTTRARLIAGKRTELLSVSVRSSSTISGAERSTFARRHGQAHCAI